MNELPSIYYQIEITEPQDAYLVAQQARQLAFSMGFSEFDVGMIALAAAEIATNVVRYALPGIATIQSISANKGIEVIIVDQGPGIADLDQAMIDGFSTHCEPSIGKGLGSAKRCVEEFCVNKSDSSGTSITLRHFLPYIQAHVEKCCISFPAHGAMENGDSYLFKTYQSDKVLLAVIDGAGKGAYAAQASNHVKDVILTNYQDELDQILTKCHAALLESDLPYSADIGLLRLLPESIEFIGLGSVTATVQSESTTRLSTINGSLGLLLPKSLQPQKLMRPYPMTVFMYSDGVVLPEVFELADPRRFELSCCQLYDQIALSDDDATLIVLRD